MLTLTGKVDNVYTAPEGVNRKGERYGGGYKVQLLCDLELENGSTRRDLVTLSTDQPDWFRANGGREVALPVGAIGNGRAITYFIRRGWRPPAAGGTEPAKAAGGGGHSLLDK